MKLNRIGYFGLAILPLIGVILVGIFIDNSILFAVLMFSYLVFRAVLDYQWLHQRGYIVKGGIWNFILPIWTYVYFDELYFQP